MAEPNWKLDDDLQTVTVTFPSDPPVVLKLNTAGVDSLLQGLGGLRSLMVPPPAPDFATGQQVQAVPDPAFVTETDELRGHSILHLRDTRFGWLHFMFPKEQARKLAVSLLMQSETTLQL